MRSFLLVVFVLLSGVALAGLEVPDRAFGEGRHLVVTVDNPAVTTPVYHLRGSVKLGSGARGQLEMLSYFPNRGPFFSRIGLANGKFDLPFNSTAEDGTVLVPTRLELWVSLEQGEARFEQLELASGSAGWWGGPTGGLVGAAVGSLLGLLGALVGWMAQRRQDSAAVICRAAGTLGLLLALAGTGAAALGQPYHVYYPLLLCGGLAAVIFGLQAVNLQRQRTRHELGRMAAMDAT
ncbi:MAG: hypothetical protein AB7S38_07145 [Vulcanimicrobiota bacterium]